MKLSIIRTRHYPDSIGMFGRILIDGEYFSVCVENGLMLMPAGLYDMVAHDSKEHPNVLAFVNPALGVFHEPGDVPEEFDGHARVACLLHNANVPAQLKGCVAPGESYATFPPNAIKEHPEGGRGVTRSIPMLDLLRERWGNRTGITAEISAALE